MPTVRRPVTVQYEVDRTTQTVAKGFSYTVPTTCLFAKVKAYGRMGDTVTYLGQPYPIGEEFEVAPGAVVTAEDSAVQLTLDLYSDGGTVDSEGRIRSPAGQQQQIQSLVSGARIPRRTNVLTRMPAGNLQDGTTTFGGFCTHIEAELAGRAVGIQIGVPNILATTPALAARFAFATALGTLNTDSSRAPSLTYTDVTWAGSTTGALAARVSATRPGWVWSDVMPASAPARTDGGRGCVIHLELREGTSGSDSQVWFNGMFAATTTTETLIPRKWRGYRSSASAALGSATFAANAVAGHIACAIRYVCMETGVTLLTIGESHDMGTAVAGVANSGGVTYADYAAAALMAAKGYPIEHANMGWGGQDAPAFTARLTDIAATFSGATLLYAAASTNSMDAPIIDANIEELRGNLGVALKAAEDNEMAVLLRASIPANASAAGGGSGGASAKNYGSGDPKRIAWDAELAGTGLNVWQPASVLSGAAVPSGSAAGQIEFIQAYTTDGLHANDAGYAAGAAVLQAKLAAMLP